MKSLCTITLILFLASHTIAQAEPLPNIALIAVDDMLYNTPESFGGEIEGLTPNIDSLAKKGMRFTQAYNTSSRCAPSRGSMMTGHYQDNYNEQPGTGNTTVKSTVLTIPEILKKRGYMTGLFGKDTHYKPIEKYNFDHISPMAAMAVGRSPTLYAQNVDTFIKKANRANRPFFISVNTHDPHRPFAGAPGEKKSLEKRFKDEIRKLKVKPEFILPPKVEVYSKNNVEAPHFVPDHEWVREEFGYYINSSHRADQFVGKIIEALERNQVLDNTLVIFLSDNGIHWPFAKSNVYVSSVKTPLIIYWKGHTIPHTSSDRLVSTIDLLPTILEATASTVPYSLPGKPLIPLFTNPDQSHHDSVFATINSKGDMGFEMRSIIGDQYIYIYNKWADGKHQFYNGKYSGGLALKGFEEAAKNDPSISERLHFFYHRTKEEMYDYQKDPDALNNLLDYAGSLTKQSAFRQKMLHKLRDSGDPFLEDFEQFLESDKQK